MFNGLRGSVINNMLVRLFCCCCLISGFGQKSIKAHQIATLFEFTNGEWEEVDSLEMNESDRSLIFVHGANPNPELLAALWNKMIMGSEEPLVDLLKKQRRRFLHAYTATLQEFAKSNFFKEGGKGCDRIFGIAYTNLFEQGLLVRILCGKRTGLERLVEAIREKLRLFDRCAGNICLIAHSLGGVLIEGAMVDPVVQRLPFAKIIHFSPLNGMDLSPLPTALILRIMGLRGLLADSPFVKGVHAKTLEEQRNYWNKYLILDRFRRVISSIIGGEYVASPATMIPGRAENHVPDKTCKTFLIWSQVTSLQLEHDMNQTPEVSNRHLDLCRRLFTRTSFNPPVYDDLFTLDALQHFFARKKKFQKTGLVSLERWLLWLFEIRQKKSDGVVLVPSESEIEKLVHVIENKRQIVKPILIADQKDLQCPHEIMQTRPREYVSLLDKLIKGSMQQQSE